MWGSHIRGLITGLMDRVWCWGEVAAALLPPTRACQSLSEVLKLVGGLDPLTLGYSCSSQSTEFLGTSLALPHKMEASQTDFAVTFCIQLNLQSAF